MWKQTPYATLVHEYVVETKEGRVPL